MFTSERGLQEELSQESKRGLCKGAGKASSGQTVLKQSRRGFGPGSTVRGGGAQCGVGGTAIRP